MDDSSVKLARNGEPNKLNLRLATATDPQPLLDLKLRFEKVISVC